MGEWQKPIIYTFVCVCVYLCGSELFLGILFYPLYCKLKSALLVSCYSDTVN